MKKTLKKRALQALTAAICLCMLAAACSTAANDPPPQTAATPTATPAAGEVADNTAITLATATEGAKLYYTQDGTEPDTTSALYSDSNKPVITTGKLTLKAIAVKDGMNNSATLTAVYTIAGAHVHQWGNWENSTATCTEAGVETRVCTLDASHTETRDIAALGHDYGDWIITSPATHTTEGVETRTCSHNATHTETRAGAARIPFTGVDELGTWLTSQTANDKDTPYNIALNIDDEDDFATLFTTLNSAAGKYVYLDLSGSTITEIPQYAFNTGSPSLTGCTTLAGITIPNSVTSIGLNAFRNCTSLTSVTIPNSITSINNGAFSTCTNLASVTIPNSITSINNGTFFECIGLTSITIPNSVTSIGVYAFRSCTSLASVTFQGTIPLGDFDYMAFCYSDEDGNYNSGDLRAKFYATDADNGTPGTYTTTAPVNSSSVWTKP